jgi:YHS domain-containing protein
MMMAPMHLTRHHSDSTKTTVLYTDPVCRAEIKNDQQELFYDYKGARYHFHSQDCMNTFKSTPEHYATHNSMHHTQNNWMWIAGGIAMGAMMFFVMVL